MDQDIKSADTDDPDHNIEVFFLKFVAVHSISISCSMEYTYPGSNDTNHGCNCMKCYNKLLLQFCNNFCNGD